MGGTVVTVGEVKTNGETGMNEPMKYRKKPVVIEAMKFDGTNRAPIEKWVGVESDLLSHDQTIKIPTLEGVMMAQIGDFIIKGVQGEFYPCRSDIFQQTYEAVSS
jgi:hypothetical protein